MMADEYHSRLIALYEQSVELSTLQMANVKHDTESFTLLYFAAASTLTKRSSESFTAPLTAKQLFTTLEERYPGIQDKVISSALLTINLEYVELEQPDDINIKAGDEVAIIPPVSSG